jgi:hypothetical protein
MSDSTGSIGTRGRRPWRRWLRAGAPLAALAVVLWMKPMGLLLWARLRILTNIPRTAIAEDPPEHAGAFPDPQGMPRWEPPSAERPVPAPRSGR